eukprot:COSAG02_NODE_4413_length_5385_cov_3.361899_1_plen_54_part_00
MPYDNDRCRHALRASTLRGMCKVGGRAVREERMGKQLWSHTATNVAGRAVLLV